MRWMPISYSLRSSCWGSSGSSASSAATGWYGLDETVAIVPPVEDLKPLALDARVTLSWSYPSGANVSRFKIGVVNVADGTSVPVVSPLDASARFVDVPGLTNGTEYEFSVVAERGTDASAAVTVFATPGVTSFVIDQPPIFGSLKSDYTGWRGMQIRVGPNPIIVTQFLAVLSPQPIPAFTRSKIALSGHAESSLPGVPVAGNDEVSVSVTTVADLSNANVGTFAWTPLPHPYTLQAHTIYFIVSSETAGGDLLYDAPSVQTTPVAALEFAISTLTTGPDAGEYQSISGVVDVPVSFRY